MPGITKNTSSSSAFKLPKARPFSFSMASLKKKEIRVHAKGEIVGHKEACIRETGKKLCWPLDVFVDNMMEHKQQLEKKFAATVLGFTAYANRLR